MTRAHVHIPPSAVLMIAGAVACFAVLDGTIKTLATRHPVPLLVWARWGFQVLAMLIWLAPGMGFRMLRTRQLRLQLVRGCLLVGSSLFFMSALSRLPLADATALNYMTPTIVIVLAIVFLNERVTLARLAFVVAGLSGMLMIVQPGAELFRGASLLALGSAGCYAVYQITTRMLAGEDPRVSLFYPALVGTLIMTFVWPWFGSRIDLTWTDVAMLSVIGVLGTVGHFLLILAFQRAPASALTPFTYIQVVYATLIGWLVYGDFPDLLTLAGMALIAGSGLLLTWHERRRALIAAPEPTAVD
ncbi:MAG TPA: DMT family transporter [Casimicrobiaceae bacterium]|nr:DMT family transporter [Casimicrobiaceae bacterium]